VGSSPVGTLTGKDTAELVSCSLVGTKHVSDFSSTGTNVSSGDIGVVTNVSGEFGHEGAALLSALPMAECTHESPDLVVGLALGVKVGSSLSTTHHQTSQGVLEDLLETEAKGQRGLAGVTHNFKMDRLTVGWSRRPPL
jgi:hypothetical protein